MSIPDFYKEQMLPRPEETPMPSRVRLADYTVRIEADASDAIEGLRAINQRSLFGDVTFDYLDLSVFSLIPPPTGIARAAALAAMDEEASIEYQRLIGEPFDPEWSFRLFILRHDWPERFDAPANEVVRMCGWIAYAITMASLIVLFG